MKHYSAGIFSLVVLLLCSNGIFAQSTLTSLGFNSLNTNPGCAYNTAIGWFAMSGDPAVSGYNNTAVGAAAFMNTSYECNSTAIGFGAMTYSNGTIGYNVAVGAEALQGYVFGNTGNYNTVIGVNGLRFNATGSENTASGYNSMDNNSSGGYNTANGAYSLYSNTSAYYNTAVGTWSAYSNTTGAENLSSGIEALYSNTTGGCNTAIGSFSLMNNQTGNNNVALGVFAGPASGSLSNAMALGTNATVSASNAVVVGSSAVTSIGGYANWTNFSDGRYKRNIQQNVPGLAFINKLTPVTYTLDISGIEAKLHANDKTPGGEAPAYLKDATIKQAMEEKSAVTYTGFVAQDVEKAADSIGFNFSGVDKPKDIDQSFYGLRYGDFVVPLVKAVQELSASSNSKDSLINVMQGQIDSVESKYNSLQAQVNELKAALLGQKSISGASLDQNVPNPFTGSTTIGYNLPKGTSSAKLQISDVTGHVLGIIPLSGSTGKSTLTASLSGYAAGTYMYSLIVNGQLVSTRQMTALK